MSLLKLMSIDLRMPSNHLVLCFGEAQIQVFPLSLCFDCAVLPLCLSTFLSQSGKDISVL